MPEFCLNTNASRNHSYYKLSSFAQGYVEAMFFTNGDIGDDKDEHKLNNMGVDRLTRKAVKSIKRDCDGFLSNRIGGLFARQYIDAASENGYDNEQAGRDFYYTRQGHGVGFQDSDALTNVQAYALDAIAKRFGEVHVEAYRGWIYHG